MWLPRLPVFAPIQNFSPWFFYKYKDSLQICLDTTKISRKGRAGSVKNFGEQEKAVETFLQKVILLSNP